MLWQFKTILEVFVLVPLIKRSPFQPETACISTKALSRGNSNFLHFVVAAGLKKIEAYSAHGCIDTFMLAMCLSLFSSCFLQITDLLAGVNPEMKLNWYQKHTPADVPLIKAKILGHVRFSLQCRPVITSVDILSSNHMYLHHRQLPNHITTRHLRGLMKPMTC
jgi:hypothetical protein